MSTGHVSWLELSKERERMKCHAFGTEAPNPFVSMTNACLSFWGCCSGERKIHFYVVVQFTLNVESAHVGLSRDWRRFPLSGRE